VSDHFNRIAFLSLLPIPKNAVSFSLAGTTKRFPPASCASAIQIVRPRKDHCGVYAADLNILLTYFGNDLINNAAEIASSFPS
jgi:hypothetical protein